VVTETVQARRIRRILLYAVVFLAFTLACADRELRGRSVRSSDGQTYLVVADDGVCGGAIVVDGQEWPHGINVAGPISPGKHRIDCGASSTGEGRGSGIEFVVQPGTTFHFDYWGP
jgi:hypothetical protein